MQLKQNHATLDDNRSPSTYLVRCVFSLITVLSDNFKSAVATKQDNVAGRVRRAFGLAILDHMVDTALDVVAYGVKGGW